MDLAKTADLFEPVRYIQNNLSIIFPRQELIRREANKFEDKLSDIKLHSEHINYSQPQIIPVPDDFDPRVPRIVFGSKHGFSQIVISQVSLALSVNYSAEWQTDKNKVRGYLEERVSVLFDLLSVLNVTNPYVVGLNTVTNMLFKGNDEALISHLANALSVGMKPSTYDFLLKTVEFVDNRYFSNVTIENYRSWENVAAQMPFIPESTRLPYSRASVRGISIVGDLNDRFAFNEQAEYVSSLEATTYILNNAFEYIDQQVAAITGKQ